MTRNIGTDANIARVRMAEQGSNPSSPSSGFGYFYEKTDGQPYFINSSGTIIKLTSGWHLLETQTASASPTLTFKQGITSAFDDYALEIVDLIMTSGSVTLSMQYSSDGGGSWDTSNNYYSAGFYIQNGGGTNTQGGNPSTSFILGSSVANTSSRPYQATIYMRSFASTVLSKVMYGNFAYTNASFVIGGFIQGLLLVPGTAYNAIKIFASSGNLASGIARLYGIVK